jgi:fatty acid desaturase
MVHHTAPHIPFKTSEEWNAAQAQLNGTVHCDYPRWYAFCFLLHLSFLTYYNIFYQVAK